MVSLENLQRSKCSKTLLEATFQRGRKEHAIIFHLYLKSICGKINNSPLKNKRFRCYMEKTCEFRESKLHFTWDYFKS